MGRSQPAVAAHPRILEPGNITFLYRPVGTVLHPRSSDEIERAFFALFPDDQVHHRNRLFALAHGYFPPIIPDQDLPEERDWAVVARIDRNPSALIADLDTGFPTPPFRPATRTRVPARIAGNGRYAIVRHGDHTYLAYALCHPTRLGPAQHALLLERTGSYLIVVKEPSMPSAINLRETPSYPEDLSEAFDGHGSIPVDPTDFLDYRWTQVFLVGAETRLEAEPGIHLTPDVENQAAKEALRHVYQQAERIKLTTHLDILRPILRGELE